MKTLAWYTDTHLDRARGLLLSQKLANRINELSVSGVVLTGDISNGSQIEKTLDFLATSVNVPIYFVLGNHDYHGRSLASVNDGVAQVVEKHPNLVWATQGVTTISPGVALVGTEGWCDARVGYKWWMRMTFDHFMIKDYSILRFSDWIKRFHDKAVRGAIILEENLRLALRAHDHAYVLTHFPPWDDSIVHGMMKRFWTAYDVNHALGDAIDRVMADFPSKRCTVLAGHTHVPTSWLRGNIECRVGYARSGRPLASERLINLPDDYADHPSQVINIAVGTGVSPVEPIQLNA